MGIRNPLRTVLVDIGSRVQLGSLVPAVKFPMIHRITYPLTQPLFAVSRKNMFLRKPPQGPVAAETDRIHEQRSRGVIEIREPDPTASEYFIGSTRRNQR